MLIINPIILPIIFNILPVSFLNKNNFSPAYKNVYFTRKRLRSCYTPRNL
jgi:hypothetical protein